jgi:serine phosphatase RsbU (regulator of sigma subunit)
MLQLPSALRRLLAGVFLFALSCTFSVPGRAVAQAPAPVLTIDHLGKGSASLDGPWQFHLGDDTNWAQQGLDDSTGQNGWEQLTADAPWGTQGHRNYVGYAWYRKHIDLSKASGAPDDVAIYIPAIDDIYEIYWNGVRMAQFGKFPPHMVPYLLVPPQTWGLGPVRKGVLAVRVYKIPLSSVDDGTAGGFESVPIVGSPTAIASIKDAHGFQWLQHAQFRFGLTSLYLVTAILSFLLWLRDRRLRLLLWVAIYSFMPLPEVIFNGLGLHISGIVQQAIVQPLIGVREMSQWFLLVYLLQLEGSKRLMRWMVAWAWISVVAGALDGGLGFLADLISIPMFTWADALLTVFVIPGEFMPVVLILIALRQKKQLDSGRWLVAALACVSALWYSVSNVANQGVRYTHWTLAPWMGQPLFQLFGSNFTPQSLLRLALFVTILYAVFRSASDYRRRQSALEQEYKSARELQQVLIPEALPSLPGFAVTSAYRPAQEVGGDFFQIIPLEGHDTGSTLILLGDVSGKGLKAAMTVSMIVGAARALARYTSHPAEILTELNTRLFGRMQGGFATCLAIRMGSEGECVVASAGHPAPYLNKAEIDLPGALPLGLVAGQTYEEQSIHILEGDHISLYTDGLLEARGANGEIFSFERLGALLDSRPDAKQAAEAAVDFGQDDDITVLTLTRLGSGQAATSQFSAPHLARI